MTSTNDVNEEFVRAVTIALEGPPPSTSTSRTTGSATLNPDVLLSDFIDPSIFRSASPTPSLSIASSEYQQLHQAATQFLENLRTSDQGWKFALSQLNVCAVNRISSRVIFFCLKCLNDVIKERYEYFSIDDKTLLCTTLMIFMRDVCPAYIQPPYVKAKLASALVHIFQHDYPDRWPSFFNDIIGIVRTSGPEPADLFVRILLEVDIECVQFLASRSAQLVQKNTRIKDSMRERDLPAIVDTIHSIIMTFSESRTNIAALALDALQEYIGWIDIALAANERFVSLFYQLLASSSAPLQRGAMHCLSEMVDKKMELSKKIAMINQFQIVEFCGALTTTRNPNDQTQDRAIDAATLLQHTGTQLVQCLIVRDDSPLNPLEQTAAKKALTNALTLTCTLFESYPFQILHRSQLSVFPQLYLKQFKLQRNIPTAPMSLAANQDNTIEFFRRIINGLYRAIAYPLDFDFDRSDDEVQDEFLAFRSSMHSLLINLTTSMPEIVIEIAATNLLEVVKQWKSLPWPRVEAAIRIFYDLGEGIRDTAPAPSQQRGVIGGFSARIVQEPLGTIVGSVLTSDISMHQHPQVILLYFTLVTRCAYFIETNPNYLPAVLSSFLDNRGICNAHAAVRKQACYHLYRLLDNLPDNPRRTIRPYLDNLLRPLRSIIENKFSNFISTLEPNGKSSSNPIPALLSNDDINYICECYGILCAPLITGKDCLQYAQPIISFFKTYLDSLLLQFQSISQSQPRSVDTKEREKYASQCSAVIDAIANISKALAQGSTLCVEIGFLSCFDSVIRALATFPDYDLMRTKSIFFLHRMIECLQERILTHMPNALEPLIRFSNANNIIPLFTLFNQMMIQLKLSVAPIMDSAFLSICSQAYNALQSYTHVPAALAAEERTKGAVAAYSADLIEYCNLLKAYLLFVKYITVDFSDVLFSGANLSHLPVIVRTILAGLVCSDAVVSRTATQILRLILLAASKRGTPSILSDNMFSSLYTDLLNEHILLMFTSTFCNPADANNALSLREVFGLQHDCATIFGGLYVNRWGEMVLQRQLLPLDQIQVYITLLQNVTSTPSTSLPPSNSSPTASNPSLSATYSQLTSLVASMRNNHLALETNKLSTPLSLNIPSPIHSTNAALISPTAAVISTTGTPASSQILSNNSMVTWKWNETKDENLKII